MISMSRKLIRFPVSQSGVRGFGQYIHGTTHDHRHHKHQPDSPATHHETKHPRPKNDPIEIYGMSLSQPTRSVLFLCEENNIPYKNIPVDARKLETRTSDFLKMFPVGRVPAMNDNGFKLTEGAAILVYLSEKHHLSQWYPSSDNEHLYNLQKRADINFWLHWHHSNLRSGTMKILVPKHYPPKNQSVDEALTKGRKEFGRGIKFLDGFLKERMTALDGRHHDRKVFLCSEDHPTIADLFLLPEIDQLNEKAFNLFDYSPYPHVQKWMSNMESSLSSYEKNFEGVIRESKHWTGYIAKSS